ncbi:4-hydroxythreonine-4-phosphate dehydrogenase PdxA [Planctomyces sp. SH-PL62]|uniref:4-hydroxythreonine-4-phosphate dehydrogenase PdxA n=1 Tax=Planctomyces sp. SH-PL62 TaxID=1636152 RepID=UPI00078D38A6|nr:4-hydroxythreonine-4-phosphate dehydrogenase PdxA [Planctomyces sp. SH-PL62]AMV37078.1 4-hydroxythreonine-4-phosphate dehydrogenase 2 [Planctomyces sp. SH-PL62]
MDRPKIAMTLGDVAGVGPEVAARAWSDPALHALCRPFVVGSPAVARRAVELVGGSVQVREIDDPEAADPSPGLMPCLEPPGAVDVSGVEPGAIDARAGRAAYDYLIHAIDLALAGRIDAIATLPLNKESLSLAGVHHPGHTEILADRCGTPDHAMMLYLPSEEAAGDPSEGRGLGVVHVTLHMALRDVFDAITVDSVASKIRLADRALRPLTAGRRPRIAVASLNPHAGENGLFGDEEIRTIRPAVGLTKAEGFDVSGPFPNDTLFHEALSGTFDAIVAMYHDQGHIALKTVGFRRGVNVTLGLPIVRTSVAHGTAFDIAWRGLADSSSLIAAVRVAARMAAWNRAHATA